MGNQVVMELENVSKKFIMGEYYDSLRDLIPALTGKLLRSRKEDQLSKNEFWALKDVSCQISKGEAFGIIGPNGAGKSTMLKLLCGIMKPNIGRIRVDGTLSALIEVGAGFHPDLTGRENIFLNGTILGMKKKEILGKFDEIVEFSGLAEFIDTPVKRYSSGMYARLGFSVAAHVNPDILLVDEVLSVGDYQFQNKCIERMHTILRNGTTIIFVSHNLKAVGELCNRAMLLEKGHVNSIGETGNIIRKYTEIATGDTPGKKNQDAYIHKVVLRDEKAESVQFETGSKVWADVHIIARKSIEYLGVTFDLKDEKNFVLFGTSTYRLANATFQVDSESKMMCTFELDLHLAPGVFHVGIGLFNYADKKFHDLKTNATSIIIHSERDIFSVGSLNLYPKVTTNLPDGSWTSLA